MYMPRHFAEDDRATLHRLIRDYGFGLLITAIDGVPFASHLPLLLDAERGEHGTILGHVAKPNPQWRGFDGATQALAVFQGPHAYVSPSWYATQPAVPTWNYAVVHAYGRPRVLDDALATVRRLADSHEAGLPEPWSVDRLPADYRDTQLKGIVAFEMPIDRLEGKFKLNQNKSAADRAGVVAGLRARGDPDSEAVAALMERREGTP